MNATWYMTAPDMSVTILQTEAEQALETFDFYDWDKLEQGMPAGSKDTSGNPIDRHNQDVRRLVLAECLAHARGALGEGTTQMNNPHFRHMIDTLLNGFDTMKANAK